MNIASFEPAHIDAIKAFNHDLRSGGSEFAFPDTLRDDEWPLQPGVPVYRERFLAVDERGVHGGYMLKHQRFDLRGREIDVGQYALPLSRAVVDGRFRGVGRRLLEDALSRKPRLCAFGMGGLDKPLPCQLARAGFSVRLIPFYFRIVRGHRFLDEIRLGKKKSLGVLAVLATKAVGTIAARPTAAPEIVERFGAWADSIWEEARRHYGFLAARGPDHLNALFWDSARYVRVKVSRGGNVIGWALLVDTRMSGNRHFGNLRVGTLVDALALPGDEDAVVSAATSVLIARGAELLITNQSHFAWRRALVRAGYLRGPSNYVFAASPLLAADLPALGQCHLTRGDGSGPINL